MRGWFWADRGPQRRCGLEGPRPLPASHIHPFLKRGTPMKTEAQPAPFLPSEIRNSHARKEHVKKGHYLKKHLLCNSYGVKSLPSLLTGRALQLTAGQTAVCSGPSCIPYYPRVSAGRGQVTMYLSSWLEGAAEGRGWGAERAPPGVQCPAAALRSRLQWFCVTRGGFGGFCGTLACILDNSALK